MSHPRYSSLSLGVNHFRSEAPRSTLSVYALDLDGDLEILKERILRVAGNHREATDADWALNKAIVGAPLGRNLLGDT